MRHLPTCPSWAIHRVGDSDGRGDVFLADKAWFYVSLLTIGYMILSLIHI